MNRRNSRQHKMHLVFALDFYKDKETKDSLYILNNRGDVLNNYFSIIEDNEDIDFKITSLTDFDKIELESDFFEICDNLNFIDDKITKSLEDYSFDRIGRCEKAILRICVYEIYFKNKDEKAVYIDEAIELSKIYCDEKAPAFVNSILDKVWYGSILYSK